MKKLMSLGLVMLSLSASATAADKNLDLTLPESARLPSAAISTRDNGVVKRFIPSNVLSRSAKTHAWCIDFHALPAKERNAVKLVIRSPGKLDINLHDATIEKSADGSINKLMFNVNKSEIINGYYEICWQSNSFDEPLGTYHIDAYFNELIFEGLYLKLVK
ncbi:hypothetical protein GVX86_07380 [[Haemophilus] felis]|nr:hypothetical protein [[Haemophilus] felis]